MKKKNSFNVVEYFYHFLISSVMMPFSFFLKKNDYFNGNLIPLYRLIHKTFVKSIPSSFLLFVFPAIFVSILGSLIEGSALSVVFMISTYIPLVAGLMVMPMNIISYKRSSLLKRIGVTKIKPSLLMFCFISYFIWCASLSSLINVGIGIAIYHSQIGFDMANIYWPGFFFGVFLQNLFAFSTGITIATFVKHETSAQAVALVIIIPGAFMSGQFIPLNVVNEVDVLRYLGWFFPQKGASVITNMSILGQNPFNIGFHKSFTVDSQGQLSFYQNLWKEAQANGTSWNQFSTILKFLIKDLPANITGYDQWNQFANWFLGLPNSQVDLVNTFESVISFVIPVLTIGTSLYISARYFRWTSR